MTFRRNHQEVIAATDFFTVPSIKFGVLYCFRVEDRTHLGLGKGTPAGRTRSTNTGRVISDDRLGGQHHRCDRADILAIADSAGTLKAVRAAAASEAWTQHHRPSSLEFCPKRRSTNHTSE